MKRVMLSLGMVLGVGFVGFHAAPAKALTPLCTPYTGGNDTQNWPNGVYFQVCGTDVNPNSASFVAATFNRIPNQSTPGTAGAALKNSMMALYANGAVIDGKRQGAGRYGVVYIFHTYKEYLAFLTPAEKAIAPGTGAGAYTIKSGATQQALWTGIWEINGVGIDNGWVGGHNILQQEAGHELGHWVDFLLSGLTGTNLLSNSSQYNAEWLKDGTNFILPAIKMCGPLTTPPPLAYGKADDTATFKVGNPPYFICSGLDTQGHEVFGAASNGLGPDLNTGYSGSNYTVIQKAWPYFYQPGFANKTNKYAEIFAEEFGTMFQGGDVNRAPVQADWYYDNTNAMPTSFACTYWWINYVASNGKLPTASINYYPAANHCP